MRRLQINRNSRPTYTYREILENRYPELLSRAEEQRDRLAELQNKVVTLLPKSEITVPNMRYLHKAVNSIETQTGAQAKITLYSLYNFADKAYLQIKNLCEVLAESINGANNITEDDAAANLEELVGRLTTLYNQLNPVLFENIGAVGLLRIQRITEYMGTKYNLHDFKTVGNWTFRDIVGMVLSQGFFSMTMILDASIEPTPTTTTIGEVIDNEKLVSIYEGDK